MAIALLASALAFTAACSSPAAPPAGSPASGVAEPVVKPAPTPELTPTPPAARISAPAQGAYLGAYTPPVPFEMSQLASFEASAGKGIAIVMWYQPWAAGNRSLVDSGALVSVWRAGKVPMITWEPWDPGTDANAVKNPATQPRFRLARINDGSYDGYIRSWARAIAGLGGPVMLRPMHEMNGTWYPWCGSMNGNSPAQYIAAWRRIHRIFTEEGASNVTWVWSINHESVPDEPDNEYRDYYPGDAFVDWTAVSGFNFGTTSAYSSWQSFSYWYADPLAYLRTLNKPICIAEMGTVEQGGDKAAWLTDAYRVMAKNPLIKAIVYYDAAEKDTRASQDWRIATSPRSQRAYRDAVRPAYFRSDTPPELTAWADELKPFEWRYLYSIAPLY